MFETLLEVKYKIEIVPIIDVVDKINESCISGYLELLVETRPANRFDRRER